MACNCGKSGSKRRQFEHVAKDGKVTVVNSQSEAISLTRQHGGTWRLKVT